MKRRDFIKGLVAAPVVAKIGVEAVAKESSLGMALIKPEGGYISADGERSYYADGTPTAIYHDSPMTHGIFPKAMWPGIDKWFAEMKLTV